MKKQNGITLIALVITIIVLLILAGITINLTIGQDGIITKAQEAGEKQKIAEYKEKIELIKAEVASENLGVVTLEGLINKLYEKGIISDGNVKISDDGTSAQITTSDGYTYIITVDNIEYIGKEDEIVQIPPDLQEGDVTFSFESSSWTEQNRNTWTKEDVTVTITTKEEIGSGFILQYSFDGNNWTEYTEPFVVKENTRVYACLANVRDEQGQYATADITVIDKLAPVEFTPTVTATTNSITIDASGAEDAESTDKYGQSGIKEIWYKIDSGEWVTNSDKTQTSYTFTELTQNASHTVQVKVIDNARNETITASQLVSTTPVTGIQTGDVTFGLSPNGETKENVAVTITGNNTGYTLQYKTEKSGESGEVTDWTNYEGAITVTRNQDIYARVVDSTGQTSGTYATGTVANIDKLAPNSFTPTLSSSTSNSITIAASTEDQTKTSDNASSGIASYKYSNDNGSTWQDSNTFGSLTGSSYTIKVKAIDNVGNETISSALEVGATYHTHSGNSSSGGGCYGGINYHTHTSSCYHTHTSSCYHSHTNSCYETYTYTCNRTVDVHSFKIGDGTTIWNVFCPIHGEICTRTTSKSTATRNAEVRNYKCDEYVEGSSLKCTQSTSTPICGIEYECGMTTSTIISYYQNCGKTTSTITGYKVK